MQSLETLFKRFNHFCYSVNHNREVPLYFGEDISAEIFNYNPSEALPYVNNAIERLNVTIQNISEILDYVDFDATFFQLNGESYESRKRHFSLEESVKLDLIARLEEIKGYFSEIKLELEKSVPPSKEEITSSTFTITIDDNFSLPRTREHNKTILNIHQTALLFHYLSQFNIFHSQLTASALAKIASVVTGHSEQKLRTTDGFGVIHDIISDKVRNKVDAPEPCNYNLLKVREALMAIVSEIDSQLK